MKPIEELLDSTQKLPFDEQVKFICDKIQEDEDLKIIDKDFKPKGPNIFLSVQVPGITANDICFICLERERKENFIISIWTKQKDRNSTLKRSQVQDVSNISTVKKLLFLFIEKVFLMRHE
jgi:hypothetical protein